MVLFVEPEDLLPAIDGFGEVLRPLLRDLGQLHRELELFLRDSRRALSVGEDLQQFGVVALLFTVFPVELQHALVRRVGLAQPAEVFLRSIEILAHPPVDHADLQQCRYLGFSPGTCFQRVLV